MSYDAELPGPALEGRRTVADILPQTHTKPLEDRFAAGTMLRATCQRRMQTAWLPPADRANPIELLIENSQGRMQ